MHPDVEPGAVIVKEPVVLRRARRVKQQIAAIKQLVLTRMMALTPKLRPEIEAVLERQLDIRNTVETRLAALSKPDFERLLRGVFEQDELTLIIVGGVLGGAVGALQAALLLAGVG